jgi:hypothetical protein
MSTTSNFHARFASSHTPFRGAVFVTALAVASGAWAADSPGPAVPSAGTREQKTTTVVPAAQRIKITQVSVRAIEAGDPIISAIVTNSERSELRNPLLVSVRVAAGFTDLARTASPVIVINGETLSDSIVPFGERNRVLAVVRDSTRVGQIMDVQVGWLGDFGRTLSEPVRAQMSR